MSTQECRAQASWKQTGSAVYTLSKFVYRVPCTPITRVVEHLGAIKERSDGRWNWWRFESKWHQTWIEGQGVATSQGAAEMRMLEGWEVENELQATRDFQEGMTLTPEQGCTSVRCLRAADPGQPTS